MGRWVWHPRIRARRLATAFAICGVMLAASLPALSQGAGSAAPAPAPVPSPSGPSDAPTIAPPSTPPVAKPAGNPGLVEELGKLFKDSASHLSTGWKDQQKALEDFNARTKDATESLTRVQTVATGRMACPVTANGAPDCNAAAEQLCKGKGFKSGKSLDIETTEKCSVKAYLSGRTGKPGECRTENVVTRAACQ